MSTLDLLQGLCGFAMLEHGRPRLEDVQLHSGRRVDGRVQQCPCKPLTLTPNPTWAPRLEDVQPHGGRRVDGGVQQCRVALGPQVCLQLRCQLPARALHNSV